MRCMKPVMDVFLGRAPLPRALLAASASVICCLASAAASAQTAVSSSDLQLDARAREIHQHVLTLDSYVNVSVEGIGSGQRPEQGSRIDLAQMQRGGLDAVTFAIAVGPGPTDPDGVAAARAMANAKLASIRSFINLNSTQVALALTSADLRNIHQQGKIAVIESFVNARSLGKSLNGIEDFYNAGVRSFGFVHIGNNDFADSSRPIGEPAEEFHGLSPLGRQAVAKLNQLGMIIDVSQLTPAGVLQVLQLSKAPVIASHSGVRALVDNARNLSDRELDAIKANGGVVQVIACSPCLLAPPVAYREKLQALRTRYSLTPEYPDKPLGYVDGAEFLAAGPRRAFIRAATALYPQGSLKDYVDHIDYIVKRIGIDHVGIGTDFSRGAGLRGFENEGEALNVTRELVRRGYDEASIAKIWGANFLRVFADVEAVSRALRSTAAR